MAVIEIARIQIRRGKEGTTGIPQLSPGEFGWAQDTENLYIGKRIAEGANTDENSRILSQKDYDNLFAIVMGAGRTAVASTSTYRYRDNLDYLIFKSTTTFIGTKLDVNVSLTDFGVTASSTATDIYYELKKAIENLYLNPYIGSDAIRNLIIPAGIYFVSDTVNLPSNLSIIGEGPGMTTLLSLTNDRPIFKTIYDDGSTFEAVSNSSIFNPKNVIVKNLTLSYTTSTESLPPLFYLDDTENSKVENVEFTIKNPILGTKTKFVGTITDISSTTTAVVTTLLPHGLDNCKLHYVTLDGIQGLDDYFTTNTNFYASVLSTNNFALYLDKSLTIPVDTFEKSPFISTSTSFTTSTIVINTVTSAITATITTAEPHGLISGNYVRFSSTDTNTVLSILNTGSFFVKSLSINSFSLYIDSKYQNSFDSSSFTEFVGTTTATLFVNVMPATVVIVSTITSILNSATSIYGIGISLRGNRRSGIEQNKNTKIINCKFKDIGVGIEGTGSVAYSLIEDNLFSNLVQGIKFLPEPETSITQISPTKSTITKNNFFDIEQQAIFVGTSTNSQTQQPNILNHSSSFNHFYRVGNGKDLNGYPDGDGIVSNTGTAVISCFGEGFVSINDKFSRKDYANPTYNDPLYPKPINFFYKPLVEGNAFLDSGSSSKIKDLGPITDVRVIDRLYVSNEPITYKISYTLHDSDINNNQYNRAGLLTINVVGNNDYLKTPEGSISDYYDYSYDELWPINNENPLGSGDIVQPLFLLTPASNKSYVNLAYTWPVEINDDSIFIGTITNITNDLVAVVTTEQPHGLSSDPVLIYLTNIEGFNNTLNGPQQFFAKTIDSTSFSLYFDSFEVIPVNTVGVGPFISPNTITTSTVEIADVTAADPVVVTTQKAHDLVNRNTVRFSSTNTNTVLAELNTDLFFVEVLSTTTFALYLDPRFETSFDGTSFTPFASTITTTASLSVSTIPGVIQYSNSLNLQLQFQYQTNIIV